VSGHPGDRGKGLGSSFYKGVEEFEKGSSSGMGLAIMLFFTQRSIIWAAAKKDV
jgi:hypothetical protein